MAVTLAANTDYELRLLVQDNGANTDVKAKVWATGTAEPAAWTLTAQDTSPLSAGRMGLFFGGNAPRNPDIRVDNYAAERLDPPPAPADLQAVGVCPTRIDLAWTDVTGQFKTGYKIERSADGSTGWSQIGTTAESVTVYSDTTVSAASTWYYRVRGTNSYGDGPYSAVASATTPAAHVALAVPKDHLGAAYVTRSGHVSPGMRFRYGWDGIGNRTAADKHSSSGSGFSWTPNKLNQATGRSTPGARGASAAARRAVRSLREALDGGRVGR